MKIREATVVAYRRFTDLTIKNIPESAKLVVLIGPNGSGKSSVFDAFNLHYRSMSQKGWTNDRTYYEKQEPTSPEIASRTSNNRIDVMFHDSSRPTAQGADLQNAVYVRTAYRHEPDFKLSGIQRVGPATEAYLLDRLIDPDINVKKNYERLVSGAIADVFDTSKPRQTVEDLRQQIIGSLSDALNRVFSDLT